MGTHDWISSAFGCSRLVKPSIDFHCCCGFLDDDDDDDDDDSMDVITAGNMSIGDTTHRNDKSKSDSMMCPSSRTSTFSGFKSLYTTPIMCRYSRANNTSAA
jgi:hypothetical protein